MVSAKVLEYVIYWCWNVCWMSVLFIDLTTFFISFVSLSHMLCLMFNFLSVFAAAGWSGVRGCLAALCAVWFLHSEQPFFSAALPFIEPPERGGAAQTTANPEGSAGWGGAWCHLYNPKKPCTRKWYEAHMHGRFVNHKWVWIWKTELSSRVAVKGLCFFLNQLV